MADAQLGTSRGARLMLEPRPERAGGTSNVHAAVDESGRRVAVKVARTPIADLLDREYELAGRLARDPRLGARVLPVLDRGTWGDRPFLVLPWCEHTLASWAIGEPDALERAARARALCEAVAALHDCDPPILHGDLKPTNVVVDADGAVRLTDFGAARVLPRGHTSTWGVARTPCFTPPEALAAGRVVLDVRSDRWALAATVVFVVTGHFEPGPRGLSPPDRRRLRAAVRAPRLEAALGRMLAAPPSARTVSAAELADALAEVRRPRSWRAPPAAALAVALAGPVDPRTPVHVDTVVVPGGPGGEAPLLAGRYEVDQATWQAVTGEDANATRRIWAGESVGPGCTAHRGASLRGPQLPVTCVAWLDVVRFANALSRLHGLPEAYTIDHPDPAAPRVTWDRTSTGWRLPTAEEWRRLAGPTPPTDEALCRRENVADATARRVFQAGEGEAPCDDGYAGPAPVRSLKPGSAGVHHAFGNVSEWLWDELGPGTRGAVGASWSLWPRLGPLDGMGGLPADTQAVAVGVRLVRSAP